MKTKWMVAGVLAATLLLVACGDDDDNDGVALSSSRASNAATPAAPRSGEVPSSGGGAASDSAPLPSLDSNRKIIFTATLALSASDVGRAFNDAGTLARGNGGYIEKSNYTNSEDDGSRRSATLTLRVPVQNYDSLVSSLRTINGATVASEGANSNEVTDQYIDLQSNQRNLERTEQQYLELLKQAKTIQEVLTVQDRLTSVRGQIEQIQGRLKVLDGLTELATVNLTISPVAAKASDSGSNWTLREVLGESWQDSLEVARYVAAAGLVALVAMAWLAVPVLLALLGLRQLRHRGRAHLEAGTAGEAS